MFTQIDHRSQNESRMEHRFSADDTTLSRPPSLVQVSIALLSDVEMQQMRSTDLLDVLSYAGMLNLSAEKRRKLRLTERVELEILADLSRRFCQSLVNRAHEHWGSRAPFPGVQ